MDFFRYFVHYKFEFLRIINKISLLLCFVFVANFAFATEEFTQEGNPQPHQEGEKKQIGEEIDPSGELEGGVEPIGVEEESTEDEEEESTQQSVDSTEDDSVSKHNFIFYFLYKLKYNENQEVQELY